MATLVLAMIGLIPASAFAMGGAGVGLTSGANVNVHSGTGATTTTAPGAAATTSATVNGTGVQVNTKATSGTQTASGAHMQLVQNAAGLTISTPAEVQTNADLQVFAKNIPVLDSQVTSATVGSSTIMVSSKHRAYLAGFIPVTITTTTTVGPDVSGGAKVHTSFPWWNFLVSGDGSVDSSVNSKLQSNTSVQAVMQGTATVTQKAAAIQSIANANASVDAATTAAVQ